MQSFKAGLSKATNVVSNAAKCCRRGTRKGPCHLRRCERESRRCEEKVADAKEKVKDAKNAAVDKVKDATLGLAKRVAAAALTKVGDKVVNAAIMDPGYAWDR